MDSNMFPHTVTLFHFDNEGSICEGKIIHNAFYYEEDKSNLNKVAMQTSCNLTVVINTSEDIKISKGYDILVKGECNYIIDYSTDEKKAKSIENLEKEFEIYTVTVKKSNLYGGIPNIVLGCE